MFIFIAHKLCDILCLNDYLKKARNNSEPL